VAFALRQGGFLALEAATGERALVAHAGRPVPTERILRHVWGTRAGGDRQLLKQLVHRLRQKIEADPASPERLRTEPGIGYVLRTTVDPA
jgi:DNA-binding response OmpR family regulator